VLLDEAGKSSHRSKHFGKYIPCTPLILASFALKERVLASGEARKLFHYFFLLNLLYDLGKATSFLNVTRLASVRDLQKMIYKVPSSYSALNVFAAYNIINFATLLHVCVYTWVHTRTCMYVLIRPMYGCLSCVIKLYE
jgi:hypothetical protein